jgi:hypothetical protein
MNTAFFDLPAVLKVALEQLGCDLQAFGSVDQHSPISLRFNDTPDIQLSVDESNVWIYSLIPLRDPGVVNVQADALLGITLAPREWSRAGYLTAGLYENALQLNASINESALNDPQRFPMILEEFYGEVKRLSAALG